ncbi:hypothetical protein [Streptomyces sp. NBC_01207]|uniref:hypothetical protein n=1 Tax=Streptomyces sp. NBC_01207 TaxID=2903772 RepID=UPI002E15CEB8|nr:hypothetical protein OG457_03455 [Streptomyces sp. NBC_01207]
MVRADLMDRAGPLRAVEGIEVDTVVHAATALRAAPMRHEVVFATDDLRVTGTRHLVHRAVERHLGGMRVTEEPMLGSDGIEASRCASGSSTAPDPPGPPWRRCAGARYRRTGFGAHIRKVADAYGTPKALGAPTRLMRPFPYAHRMVTTSMHVSNARAGTELGWATAHARLRRRAARTAGGLPGGPPLIIRFRE